MADHLPPGLHKRGGQPTETRAAASPALRPGELNAERFELGKTGKLLFNHPEGTHDDRFWAVALAVYATEQTPPPLRPTARVI